MYAFVGGQVFKMGSDFKRRDRELENHMRADKGLPPIMTPENAMAAYVPSVVKVERGDA